MLSKFEDLHIRLHPDYVHKLSAFSRWPWATKDDSSLFTELYEDCKLRYERGVMQ